MIKDKEIGYILHKAAMLSKYNFTHKLNAMDITPGQYIVLEEVYCHQMYSGEAGLSPRIIAENLHSDRPTISGIIERLEAQGWVERSDNIQDRRSLLISVTDKTLEKFKELEMIAAENSDAILKGFSKEESISFKNFLLRIIDNLQNIE